MQKLWYVAARVPACVCVHAHVCVLYVHVFLWLSEVCGCETLRAETRGSVVQSRLLLFSTLHSCRRASAWSQMFLLRFLRNINRPKSVSNWHPVRLSSSKMHVKQLRWFDEKCSSSHWDVLIAEYQSSLRHCDVFWSSREETFEVTAVF